MCDKRGTMTYVTDTKNCGFWYSLSALGAWFQIACATTCTAKCRGGFWD